MAKCLKSIIENTFYMKNEDEEKMVCYFALTKWYTMTNSNNSSFKIVLPSGSFIVIVEAFRPISAYLDPMMIIIIIGFVAVIKLEVKIILPSALAHRIASNDF